MDWERLIKNIGEGARPVVLSACGLSFAAALLIPYVGLDKLIAAGGVVTALFAVKGQDLRAELRAGVDKVTATTKTTETMVDDTKPVIASVTTEKTEPKGKKK